MSWQLAGLTDVGRKREHNEDSLLVAADLNLVAVADGMGGHAAGEVASGLAVEELARYFAAPSSPDAERTMPPGWSPSTSTAALRLLEALDAANLRILHEAHAAGQAGMGTTCVAALLEPARATVAWVGDSRAYLYRDGAVTLLTEDHSLVNELLRSGQLKPADLATFPHGNVITRALGASGQVEADVVEVTLQDGDVLLLCCDGVNGMLEDAQIAEALALETDLTRAAQALVDAANAAGGLDNITVVLARWNADAA